MDKKRKFDSTTKGDRLSHSPKETKHNHGTKTNFSQECQKIQNAQEPLFIPNLGNSFECLKSWSTKEGLLQKAGKMRIKYFVSHSESFYLDGTWHPQAMLTNLNSKTGTLQDFVKDLDWSSRYMVEKLDSHNILAKDLPVCPWFYESFSEPPCLCQIFVSMGPTKTQFHRDWYDNIYLCVSGQREWKLADPSSSSVLEREPGSVSARDLPSDQKTDILTISLQSGDGIFVPKGWWHSVKGFGDISVAVNWYFKTDVEAKEDSKIQHHKPEQNRDTQKPEAELALSDVT